MCKHILDGSEFQVNGENMHLWVVKKVEVFIVTVFFFQVSLSKRTDGESSPGPMIM